MEDISMKNIKLLFVSLLTVFSFNAFGMEEGAQTNGKEEEIEEVVNSNELDQSSKVPALKDLSAARVVGAVRKGLFQTSTGEEIKKLGQLMQALGNAKESEDYKTLIAQQWMKDHPLFEKLEDYCPLVKREGLEFEDTRTVHWRPDSKQVAIKFNDSAVKFFDVENWKEIKNFEHVELLHWRPDSKQVAIKFNDSTVKFFDVENWKEIKNFEDTRAVHWRPDSKRVAVEFDDGVAKFFDTENWEELKSFKEVSYVYWRPDSKQVVIKHCYSRAELLNAENWEEIKNFEHVCWFDWSPDGKQVIIAFHSSDEPYKVSSTTNFFDAENWQEIKSFKNTLGTHRWGSNSKRVVIEFDNNIAKLLNVENWQEIKSFEKAWNHFWRPGGKQVMIMRHDGGAYTGRVYTENGNEIQSFDVDMIWWRPDGKQIMISLNSRGQRKGIELWQIGDSAVEKLKKITSHQQAIALEKVHEILSDPALEAPAGKKATIESLKQQENVDTATIDKVLSILGNE